MQPIRVLHLLKTAVGAAWALHQMRELVRLGVEVHVALPDGPLVARCQDAGIHVHVAQFDMPVRAPWRVPVVAARLRNLVATLNPDLIHSHFVGTTLMMRLALGTTHPTPRIFQVPGPLHLESPFFRRAELATAGPHDCWIGSCRWTCDTYLKMGIDPARVFLSYYGTDISRFARRERGKLRSEIGAPPERRIIGMVAYMYPPKWFLGQYRGLKGHEDLIDAVRILVDAGHDVQAVFVGGAWNGAHAYEGRVRRYGYERLKDRAVFLGTRHDVLELYPDFDVAVHPSHSENVGGAVESLLLGVPTITTNVGGFPDVMTDGESGLLVPPRNPNRLAEAIEATLSDPERARLRAERGRERVRRLFDVRTTAAQVAAIYETILMSRRIACTAVI